MPSPQTIATDACRVVAGVEAQRFALTGNTVLSGRVMGWGPGLHRTGFAVAFTPTGFDPREIERRLEPFLETQRRRRETARAIGLSTFEQVPATRVSHLVVDRVVADALGAAAVTERALQVAKAAISASTSWRSDEHRVGSVAIRDAGPADGGPAPVLHVTVPTDEGGVFDGRTLTLSRRLPDSVLPACVGRTLGEIVEMFDPRFEDLATRRVLAVSQGETDAIAFTLEQRLVPMPKARSGK